jgi:hypothetical protein
MDPALAEAFAKRLADWMDIGAQFAGSAEFYRGIVEEIGEMFGLAAKTADDGTVGDSVLALKVPGLVRELIAERMLLQKRLASW